MPNADIADIATVRKRPGMYVGDTNDGYGLRHLLWEVVGNSLDEHLAGRATRIDVTFNDNDSVTVEDDGAGFPVHDVDGIPFAELALTSFHDTGTLDGHAPHAHVGLHGVGICAVNALSASLVLEVFRDGHYFRQRYCEGLALTKLEKIEPTHRHGTRITFTPDPKIFSNIEMSSEIIAARLRELALLNTGLRIDFRDDRRRSYAHPEGLAGFLDDPSEAIVCRGITGEIRVDVALGWGHANGRSARLQSFANQSPTTAHGTHVDGMMRGIADVLAPRVPSRSRYSARMRALIARDLQAVVHVNLATPNFSGPTKDRLASKEAADAVHVVVAEQLGRQLDGRPELLAMLRLRIPDASGEATDA